MVFPCLEIPSSQTSHMDVFMIALQQEVIMTYTLQDAKAKFSEVVGLCLSEGPQTVTRHGKNVVVVVPYEEYERLTAPRQSLAAFFQEAPRAELEINRFQDRGRRVDLE